jgi:membrane-associated HD superfamily phosphohydrolase
MNYRSWIGILTGFYALAGIFIAKQMLYSYKFAEEGLNMLPVNIFEMMLMAVAFLILLISLITIYIIKRKNSLKFSNKQRLHFYISLVIGGILVFMVANKGYYHLIASVSLIYYGIFLLNLNRFLKTNIIIFATTQILVGFIAYYINNYSLLFLAIGFGVLQIIFGIYLTRKVKNGLIT